MIEVGDCFKVRSYIFEVIHINQHRSLAYKCNVWYNGVKVALSEELKKTLLRMEKLSSLEKELM
jgi:hypothetical protein